ncbi:MAG: hypothetical protein ACOYLK_14085 [Sphingomonas sp.]
MSQAKLLFWINDRDGADFAGIGNIQWLSGQPFIKKPYPARKRPCRRCPNKIGDRAGFDCLEKTGKDGEIDTLPLDCESEVTGQTLFWAVARCEHYPLSRCDRVMAFGNGSEAPRQRQCEIKSGYQGGVANRRCALRQCPCAKTVHR